MIVKPLFAACIAVALATPALAQSTRGKPLNLELPPNSSSVAPATTRTASEPAHSSSSLRAEAEQPGMYYGDTSGRAGAYDDTAEVPPCNDDTYGKPQVHGSVGMGVISGRHVGGNYQSGTMNITKAFGSCEHRSGGVSISIGVGRGHFDGPHWHH